MFKQLQILPLSLCTRACTSLCATSGFGEPSWSVEQEWNELGFQETEVGSREGTVSVSVNSAGLLSAHGGWSW